MGKSKIKPRLSIRTKVIVPVIVVMVLLVAVSMTLVDQLIRKQLVSDNSKQLETANSSFETLLTKTLPKNMRSRFPDLNNTPRFRAMSTLLSLKNSDPNNKPASANRFTSPHNELPTKTDYSSGYTTYRNEVKKLLDDKVADIILLTSDTGLYNPDIMTSDAKIGVAEFKASCADQITQVLTQPLLSKSPPVSILLNHDRLFDVTSMPIVGAVDKGDVIGSITFGVEDSLVDDFRDQKTYCRLVLLANGHVVAFTSTPSDDRNEINEIATAAAKWAASTNSAQITQQELTGKKHSRALFNQLKSDSRSQVDANAPKLSYALVYDYEDSWTVLRKTQNLLLLVNLSAVLIGAVIVGLVVRRATKPLAELRESTEAIGSGDFSRRVEVRTHDEFGELASSFNQMTENLKTSREQLEATLDRLKSTQAQLIQSEKLSGIGEFIAGVAHELNNPLTTVMGFSELLKQGKLQVEHQPSIDMIFKSAQRCQKIVQSLLSFARRHQPERKPACVNSLVESALEILQYQLRTSNIEVISRLDANLPQALVDSHQIHQVLVNILNNARQAIEAHQPKGWIKIITEPRGPNVCITIQDSGPGIPPESLSKIFDPFFTTKDIGKGTGLGLSLCYGIIQEHGGTIVPHSRPGQGAMFVIELPITDVVEKAPPAPVAADPINDREGEGKKILVIDDEEPILQMVREILTRHGYQVDAVNDGEAGLNRLRQTNYDVTLCDWKMPGLNGQQVYERLRAMNPALAQRLIFLTGDLVSDKTLKFFEAENKVCLAKPFTLSEFRGAISKVLMS